MSIAFIVDGETVYILRSYLADRSCAFTRNDAIGASSAGRREMKGRIIGVGMSLIDIALE